jgi:hypothetical protein
MPSFLSSLRRKSKANIKTERPETAYANGHSNGVSRSKSSSTLNSTAMGSSSTSNTPATSTSGEASGQNGVPPLPTPRPQRPGVNPTKRYSMNVRTHVPLGHGQAETNMVAGPILFELSHEFQSFLVTRTPRALRLGQLLGRVYFGPPSMTLTIAGTSAGTAHLWPDR